MRVSVSWYYLKQGIINICRNILFLLASIATIPVCIFLFHLFFALMANVQDAAKIAEITMGTTVFFSEDMPEEQILIAGDGIRDWEGAREARYISAAQAWENPKAEYSEGMGELAEGFADDNPLSGSASYKIFLSDIERQDKIMGCLEGMEGVGKVHYSSTAVARLTNAGKMMGAMSATIICVLLAVVVFLANNTISVVVASCRREDEIMHLVGATNYMIHAPFVVEGVLFGALGAAVSLAGMYVLYQRAVIYIDECYQILTDMFEPIPLGDMFPCMVIAIGCLGTGIGLFVNYFTIHRYLKI